MEVSYSAPAKVILSGEHGVVYGKPALVSAIDLRLISTVTEASHESTDELIRFISKTVLSYLKKKNIKHESRYIKLTFKSDIPRGRGLGSSAALSVSAAAACLHFFTNEPQSKDSINNIAYLIEKRFHANPSGVDVSASCFGGLIFYRKEFEFLKTISALNFKLPIIFEKDLYLIDSGKPKESTKDMVQTLGSQFNASPDEIEKNLMQMEKITKKMTLAIIKEDKNLFAECIDKNQKLLENLGLVSNSTIKLLQDISIFGSGKITGAGGKKSGSGYIIFLSNASKLEKYLENKKIKYMKFKQNSEGVKKI